MLLCETNPNTEFFLVRIQEITTRKKIRIWTLFTQCVLQKTEKVKKEENRTKKDEEAVRRAEN